MENVQTLTDKLPLDIMDDQESDEHGEPRCSDLDVPLFSSEDFEPTVTSCVSEIIDNDGKINKDAYQRVFKMCYELINSITETVLKELASQVQQRECTKDDADNTGGLDDVLRDDDETQSQRNYCRVTEDDIQASLGNSFDNCFGVAFGVTQTATYNSEIILQVVAMVVTKKVNQGLQDITATSSLPMESAELETCRHIEQMIYHVLQIFRRYISRNNQDLEITSLEDQEILDQEFSSSLDEEDNQQSLSDSSGISASTTTTEEPPQKNKTFLTIFLSKLLDHITIHTNTSILNVDFDGILQRLTDRTDGNAPLTETVGNLHIPVYKKLCRRFGSAKMVQAAMASGDGAFEDAVALTLEAQLVKTRRNISFGAKVKAFFTGKSRMVATTDERNTLAPDCEAVYVENGSTPSWERRQRPVIIRMFSSITRILKKPFTCR